MGDNPFELSDDDEVSTSQDDAAQKREAADIRKRLKAAEALTQEVEELRAFRQEREKADRQNAVTSVFNEVGLNPKWAGFYNGDDSSPEAIKAWAIEQEFIQPQEDDTPAPVQSTGFTPTVIPDSAPLGSKIYSGEEFELLLKHDPKKAEAVYKAGRYKKEEPDWKLQTRFYGRD